MAHAAFVEIRNLVAVVPFTLVAPVVSSVAVVWSCDP